MKKVYLFLAQGFELIEGFTVVDILRRAGVDVVTVSITGEKMVMSSHNVEVKADQLFEETKFSDAMMYVLPGGMPGTTNLYAHKGLQQLLLEANDKDIKLAAICAAPSVFGLNHLLEGKEATCYPGFEEKLLNAKVSTKSVVVDGNMVTGKGMGVSIPFALQIVKMLVSKEKAEEIRQSIEYPFEME